MPPQSNLKAALYYRQKLGYSVIPVGKDKRPLIKWEPFQKAKADPIAIKGWFRKWPEANIGIVCGEISGVTVIDSDSPDADNLLNEYLPDTFTTPTAKTPKGRHLYFDFTPEFSNAVRLVSDIDIRNNGGYVVAPPSANGNGKKYEWLIKPTDSPPQKIPASLFDILLESAKISSHNSSLYTSSMAQNGDNKVDSLRQPQTTSKDLALSFVQGMRDDNLFHVAHCLKKGHMSIDNIRIVLSKLASMCDPPFDEKDIELKIKSVIQRSENRIENLSHDIRQFVATSKGIITTSFIHKEHQITSPEQKKQANTVLYRMENEGLIEKTGRFAGEFRILDLDCAPVDWITAVEKSAKIALPFELNRLVEIMPGDIILFAGTPNVGKTGILMNIAKDNIDNFTVHYFSSELRAGSFKRRFLKNPEIKISGLKGLKFLPRDDNFHEVIKPGPGNLNIIDYMEALKEPYLIGQYFAQLYSKLNGAIAVVAIQKKPGSETGYGGTYTNMRPVLVINLDRKKEEFYNVATIQKLKEPKEDYVSEYGHPAYMKYHFNLVDGIKIIRKAGWHR